MKPLAIPPLKGPLISSPSALHPIHVGSPVCQAPEWVGKGTGGTLGGFTWGQPAGQLGSRGWGAAPEAAVSEWFSTARHAGEESVEQQLPLLQLCCQLHSS